MKFCFSLSMTFFFALCLFFGGCVSSSDEVVKVTSLQTSQLGTLKAEDRAKLEEIRKSRGQENLDQSIAALLEETPHYNITEYLKKHPEIIGQAGQDYKVGGYDVLSITVYEEKDLSREAVRVSADGHLSFPLIGRVKVDGLTTAEIEKLISLKLAEGKYLLDAHVSVMVTDYKSKKYLVLGSVKNPASYSLQAQERVLDAISRAGGLEFEKTGKKGMIIRTENPNTANERKIVINFELMSLLKGKDQISNIFLFDKDVLYVPPAEHFYIIGQVKEPGSHPIRDREITLVEAISMAGGFTPIAARNKTRIIRVEAGIEKIIEIRVDAITDAGKKIQDVVIQPNDIIFVPESFF
ncbi:MAG: polysaccharide export protein [Desulfobacterota bacterium]|nr:polysaccharide export protein [Thermodesulfobacteriota bacterium]